MPLSRSRLLRPLLILAVGAVCAAPGAIGQVVPVEGMVGGRNLYYQHGVVRALREGSPFGFSHVASFHAFHDPGLPPEAMGQAYLTYGIRGPLRVAVGGFYASGPGFRPALALQWSHRWERINVLLVPRADLRARASVELMGMVELVPRQGDRSGPYARLQAMLNAGPVHHNRSYVYYRLGWALGATRFGLALNMDSFGACRTTHANAGVFVRQHF